jgi:AIG2-like family
MTALSITAVHASVLELNLDVRQVVPDCLISKCIFLGETFTYFGYGSNLLAARIHIQNPTAVFQTIARLDNYRLEFDYDKSSVWRGAAATITESPGDHVWGVVWVMNKVDLPSLDIQEGVANGIYEVETMCCQIV